MRARVSLVCSLLLLAACDGPKIIGNAYDDSEADGGPGAVNVDRTLEKYAKEIGGVWEGTRPDFKITFTPSQTNPRTGAALVEAYPAILCLLITCLFDTDAGQLKPPKQTWEIEYWFLSQRGAGALVTLPDLEGQLPFALNCIYVPGPSRQLQCGPDGMFVLLPADPP